MTDAQVPDLRDVLFGAQQWYAELVGAVTNDQLTAKTPCDEFGVRELMAHVALVFDKVIAFGRDHRDPYGEHDLTPAQLSAVLERLAVERVDALTPNERARAANAQIAEARAAWTDDVLDTPIQLGWGPILPGRIVATIYIMETLAHAWDLATATGQQSEAPRALAEAGLAVARLALPEQPRGIENGLPFGPVVPSAPDAGPTERLANWTGRVSRPGA